MKPEQCGFGRSLESLTPGDRKAVEDFRAFLEGRVALTADGATYVAFSDPRAAIAGCGCRWERTGRGVKFTARCEFDAPMCRTLGRAGNCPHRRRGRTPGCATEGGQRGEERGWGGAWLTT